MGSISLKYKSKSGNLTAPGDVDPGAMIPIATITTGTGNFSFTSIPDTYQHLQLRIKFNTTNAGGNLGLYFNNAPGTAIYSYHGLSGTGAAATVSAVTSDSSIGLFYTANGFTATYPNVAIINIYDYSSTTKNKTLRSFAGTNNNSTTGEVHFESGLWASTSAINRIDSSFMSGNSNVSYALYGIKRAGA